MAFVWSGKLGVRSKKTTACPLRVVLARNNCIRVYLGGQVVREMMGKSDMIYYRLGVDMEARKIALMIQTHPGAGWRPHKCTDWERKRSCMMISINTVVNFGIQPEELAPYDYPDFARDRDSGLYVALFRNRVRRGEKIDEDA